MTRRDYIRIAAALREARERGEMIRQRTAPFGESRERIAFDNTDFGLQLAEEALIEVLAADNPRFDADRFSRAAAKDGGR